MRYSSREVAIITACAATVAVSAALVCRLRGFWGGENKKNVKGVNKRPNYEQSSNSTESTTPPAVLPTVPQEPKVSDADRARAMELLQVLKQRANSAFQEGRYEDAIKGYEDCISVTSALGSLDTEAIEAEQVIRANVVMAFIKLQRYEDARLVATMLLQDGQCKVEGDLKVKVLYRRGLASKALGEIEAARSDFNAAIYFSPGHKNAVAEKEVALLSSS